MTFASFHMLFSGLDSQFYAQRPTAVYCRHIRITVSGEILNTLIFREIRPYAAYSISISNESSCTGEGCIAIHLEN